MFINSDMALVKKNRIFLQNMSWHLRFVAILLLAFGGTLGDELATYAGEIKDEDQPLAERSKIITVSVSLQPQFLFSFVPLSADFSF